PRDYERSVMPYSARIFQEVKALGVPTIHFGTGAASLLDLMAQAGGDLMSLDWRVSLDDAWARIGYDRGVQGNLDPVVMYAPVDVVEAETRDILRRAAGRPGHIFNLGHGVLPETDPSSLTRLVDYVHEASARS